MHMKYVADTNTFLAVALNEPEKSWLIQVTEEHELAAPAVLPYEIGNALSALAKRRLVLAEQLPAVWDAVTSVSVELVEIDVRAALVLAGHFGIYAYDAYFLQCAVEKRCSLLTLDKAMKRVAKQLDIRLVEQT